jgi:hypothetical protein
MFRKFATWLAALGASMMMLTAHAYGAIIQKPMAPPKSVTAKPVANTSTTTLTGCLRMDGKQFELTHPKGSEVRIGRNWKTGFIKKTARNVEVEGASSNVMLRDHVGHEVSVVGTRSDETHLRASSVRRVAGSCEN